jgi:membrane fusion protein (multidrug efflux system)
MALTDDDQALTEAERRSDDPMPGADIPARQRPRREKREREFPDHRDRDDEGQFRNKDRERQDDKEKEPDDKDDGKKQSRFSLDTLRRHPWITAAVVVLLLAALIAAFAWWLHARHFESTDDAFIDTRAVSISAQVAGAITDVPVTDNELVQTGTPLLYIDKRDYLAARDQARAKLDEAQANVGNLDAQISAQHSTIEQAQKQVTSAQAGLTFSQQQEQRAIDLLARGAGTQQAAEQTNSDLTQKQAALAGAQANATVAQKQLAVLSSQRQGAMAQVEEANANLMQAQTNLDRTAIRAPEEGRVAKLTAAKGGYAQVGQSQMMFVPRSVWVTANFKETQLADMRVGQPVDISVDAYPGRTFHAHVDSIQPGSGTVFSLLPAENATGNFVKVVQRVPVKLVFDNPPNVYLGPGMSVEPSVRVR